MQIKWTLLSFFSCAFYNVKSFPILERYILASFASASECLLWYHYANWHRLNVHYQSHALHIFIRRKWSDFPFPKSEWESLQRRKSFLIKMYLKAFHTENLCVVSTLGLSIRAWKFLVALKASEKENELLWSLLLRILNSPYLKNFCWILKF